ncbi:MAG: 16S rRNA (cytosine967-C5)-methyltransferase [Paracoccaceae bacterium]|jgi:16S rRNA (cytosine967-C5)-methyltransferase
MSGKAIGARLAATQLLHAVLFNKRLLSEALNGEDSPIARLSGPDRARAQSMTIGVLRHLQRLDSILDGFLEKAPPPKVRNALRLAAYEMLAEGNPAHGVVNAAVEIVRGNPKYGHMAGLVNAVSRKVADQGADIWASQSPQKLPSWLAKPIAKNFGKEAVPQIEAAHQNGAPIDLTLKDPAQITQWAETLDAEILPTGSLRLKGRPQITALPGFDNGDWWVQDAAAAMPARLFGDIKGKQVLDLCAAPGGKTMQLAAAGAKVTALDISGVRIKRVDENLVRTNLSAMMVVEDVLEWQTDKKFDAILLDAPCTATGTIRRHPDLPHIKAGADLTELFQLQADMIDAAMQWLKPGGFLVYGTCSLLPREGETQVKNALERHSDLAVVDLDLQGLGLDVSWGAAQGGIRLRPDFWAEKGGMDGFYMALLQKS